jgi:hypothetical protein
MSAREQIKKELAALGEQGKRLCQLITDEDKELDTRFRLDYQTWYSKSLRVVKRLAPDRYEEFRRYYEPDPKRKDLGYGTYVIQDYLKGVIPNSQRVPGFDSRDQTAWNVFNQLSVFMSIEGRADSVLDDLEGALLEVSPISRRVPP